jgi:hypothetical protein
MISVDNLARAYDTETHLLDDLYLPVEASGSALHQRNVGSKAHPVHMPPRIQVVQRVEDDIKRLEPRDVEVRVLDIVVVRLDLDVGVELSRRLLCNLSQCQRISSHTLHTFHDGLLMLSTS